MKGEIWFMLYRVWGFSRIIRSQGIERLATQFYIELVGSVSNSVETNYNNHLSACKACAVLYINCNMN